MGGFGGIREPKVKDLRERPTRPRCCGCHKQMTMRPGTVRPICARCMRVPSKRNKAIQAWENRRQRELIEKEARKATKNLPRKDTFTPLQGEALVLKMQRGEW